MIHKHTQFIEAINARTKIRMRLRCEAGGIAPHRLCAPMDYGPGGEAQDWLHRYWVWDYGSAPGNHTLGLLPQQIADFQILNEVFDPADLWREAFALVQSPGIGIARLNGGEMALPQFTIKPSHGVNTL